MSVAAGKYLHKSRVSFAAGAPRSNHNGQVYMFNKLPSDMPMEIVFTITGEQFASSFGYEIVSTDLNNDG